MSFIFLFEQEQVWNFMVAMEVNGIRINQFTLKKKVQNRDIKDMILTASKSENESELRYFAGHKAV